MRDLNEVVLQNPEPYNMIYEFIKSKIIPKYPCSTYCYQSNFDEEGNPKIQYYIRYAEMLSVEQWDNLFLAIFNEIMEFCKSHGIIYGEDLDVDFILTVDGDFFESNTK